MALPSPALSSLFATGGTPPPQATSPSGSSFDSSTLLAAGFFGQGIASLGGAFVQSQAYKMQAHYQAHITQLNNEMADVEAADAEKRGTLAEMQYAKEVKQVIGGQRASLAAQGVELDSGSALQIQEDTASQGRKDLLTIKNNAWREAWGYKTAAINGQAVSSIQNIGNQMNANTTLLTGGLQAANAFALAGLNLQRGRS